MKRLFVQAPYPEFYDLLRHIETKHADDIDGLVYWTADVAQLGEARFSQVPIYLGGNLYPYAGPGTRYYEGMMNDEWRWNALQSHKGATVRGLSILGDRGCEGFYITEEIDISSLINAALRLRVEWYLLDLLRFYHSLDPNLPVLWSPFASSKLYSATHVARFCDLLVNVFSWLKTNDGISPHLQIHFQDGVGAKQHTSLGAVQWGTGIQNSIEAAPILSNVSFHMNVEMFEVDNAGVHSHAAQATIADREFYYISNGLDIGACWEARYWRPYVGYLNNHPEKP